MQQNPRLSLARWTGRHGRRTFGFTKPPVRAA